jgi:hypothetical protein
MALPQIEYATYQLTLPSTKKTIKYRPFNVKEEKIFMMAMESKDQGDMINAVIQIIENCTMGNIKKVEELPYFDIEYIFIQLRKKSVGEIVNANKKCSCGFDIPIEINLDEVIIDAGDKPSNVIQVSDSIGIEMKYPSITGLDDIGESDVERTFNMIVAMISSIYDGDTVHKASDSTKEELLEWIEGLPENTFIKINDFMSDMPKMVYNSIAKCPECGEDNMLHLEGLSSFFG